jgi:polar amino acid transport system substrate-binding protein
MVGFNRRFSPHTKQVKTLFEGRGPLVVTIRVNAGPIPPDSWIHDPVAGGGRLLGEGCHFVDLAQHLVGARIKRVFASHLGAAAPGSKLRDNFVIHLDFEGGSLATITYTSKGDPSLGKERIDVFGAGMSAVIDDFASTTIARGRKSEKSKAKIDKGHREEITQFVRFASSGGKPPIALDDLEMTSLATIAAVESLELGLPIEL